MHNATFVIYMIQPTQQINEPDLIGIIYSAPKDIWN